MTAMLLLGVGAAPAAAEPVEPIELRLESATVIHEDVPTPADLTALVMAPDDSLVLIWAMPDGVAFPAGFEATATATFTVDGDTFGAEITEGETQVLEAWSSPIRPARTPSRSTSQRPTTSFLTSPCM